MTLRDWTDPRDGRHWSLWLERVGTRAVLAFASDGDVHTVVIDVTDVLEDPSDADLQRLLDEGKG